MLLNSVSMRLTHDVRLLTASQMWARIKADATTKSQLYKIDAKRRLGEAKCAEDDDMNEHLDKLTEIRDELLAMGTTVPDEEYTEILIASLPASYRSLIASIIHSATVQGTSVKSEALIRVLREEAKHKAIETRGTASSDTVLAAQKGKQKHKKSKSAGKKCFNCGKEGHIKADCWAEGGGKEGQGPKQKNKDKSANVAIGGADGNHYAFTCTSDCANAAIEMAGDRIKGVMDTGASDHFCPERDKFVNYKPKPTSPIYAADGRALNAIGEGDITCWISNGEGRTHITLKKAIHAPDMANTLISVGRLDDAGLVAIFGGASCKIQTKDGKVIGIAPKHDRLYRPILEFDEGQLRTANVAVKRVSLADAHRILGHISYPAVRFAIKSGAVQGLQIDENSPEEFCEACAQAKPHRKSFPDEASNRSKVFRERLIGDTWGPAQVTSIGGHRYSFDLVDDATRWTNVEFVPAKKNLIERYKRFETQIETEHGARVKYLRVDQGTEFKNKEFDKHLAERGTKWEFAVHDTHEQVGVVERWNRTKIELARAMLVASGLPKNLWAEAVNHATWLKNRLPTKALSGGTPFEGRYKKKPDLGGLVPFGTTVWVKIVGAKKLDKRARKGHFVGYDMTSTGYRIYFPDKRKIGVEREVAFNMTDDQSFIPPDIEIQTKRANAPEAPNAQPVDTEVPEATIEEIASDAGGELPGYEQDDNGDVGEPDVEPQHHGRARDVPDPSLIVMGTRQRPQQGFYKALNQPPRTARIAIFEETIPEPCEPIAEELRALATVMGDDPQSLDEAFASEHAAEWRKAWESEISQLKRRGTWELTPRPKTKHVIPYRPAFHAKRGPDGTIIKFKARLTAGGHRQVEGIDYGKMFASVAKLASIRLVLSYAAAKDWEIHHVDVVEAFLNAELEEEIYMEAPDSALGPGDEGKVCRLVKGLYGLKQAGRAWYKDMRRTFEDLGFVRSAVDHSVFIRKRGAEVLVVPVATDDMTVAGTPLSAVQAFKREMAERYEITDLGEVRWLLGFEVVRNRQARTISLSQRSYIEAMANRFRIADSKPVYTPMEAGVDYSKPEHLKRPADAPYREACGHLLWPAMIGRPDILFSVVHLAQFVSNPSESQWKALKRVMRYLYTTRDYCLTLGGSSAAVSGYTDSDWASQLHRHSISGYAYFLGEGCVTWSSKKQPIIALSTAEAEYVAGTHSSKEASWIRAFMSEIDSAYEGAVPLACDNQSAIAMTKDARYHARTKHIDIRYHYIREQVESDRLAISYVPSEENVADIFTKALPRVQFEYLVRCLGLGNRPA
jgi:Reverse transcriptase (RNA-dependent DNA polymerase)/gag-polypeptide of LTR copia-type/Zinc knuckle